MVKIPSKPSATKKTITPAMPLKVPTAKPAPVAMSPVKQNPSMGKPVTPKPTGRYKTLPISIRPISNVSKPIQKPVTPVPGITKGVNPAKKTGPIYTTMPIKKPVTTTIKQPGRSVPSTMPKVATTSTPKYAKTRLK